MEHHAQRAELAGDVIVLPASFAQQRLWFLDRLEPDRATYNVPLATRLRGPLDVAALASALSALVERHEALRARISRSPTARSCKSSGLPRP
jgi:hypothetical protein